MKLKLIIIIFIISGSLFADLTIRALGGFGLGAGRQFMGVTEDITTGTPPETNKAEPNFISLGLGIPLNFDVVIGLSDFLALQAGIGFHLGFTPTAEKYVENDTELRYRTFKGRYMPVNVGLTARIGNKNMKPYLNGGLVLGFFGRVYEEEYNDNAGGFDRRDYVYSMRPGIGFQTAGGMEYTFKKSFTLVFELRAVLMSMRASQRELVKELDNNGVEQDVENMDADQKIVEYNDHDTSFTNPNGNKPDQDYHTPTFPFHNIQLNFGIAFKF